MVEQRRQGHVFMNIFIKYIRDTIHTLREFWLERIGSINNFFINKQSFRKTKGGSINCVIRYTNVVSKVRNIVWIKRIDIRNNFFLAYW
jgi:hypothetical protein